MVVGAVVLALSAAGTAGAVADRLVTSADIKDGTIQRADLSRLVNKALQAKGEAGPTGPQGEAGPTGPQGEAGPTGPQGGVGAVGPMGSRGAGGADGATGPTGTAGPTGATGATGATGTAGTAGRPVQQEQRGDRDGRTGWTDRCNRGNGAGRPGRKLRQVRQRQLGFDSGSPGQRGPRVRWALHALVVRHAGRRKHDRDDDRNRRRASLLRVLGC